MYPAQTTPVAGGDDLMRFDSVKVILFMLVILFALSGAACASEQSAGGAAAVSADLSKLPLSFIPNLGQADPAVLFQVKAEGHTIFLTKEEVVLVADNDGTPAVFSTTVAGANPAATVVGVDPLPGTASFFVGNDPANWHSGLSTFGGVEYKNVLPGIDLTYRGKNGVLKREFVVAPGADASGIVIVYDNIDGLAYGPDGTLEVQTSTGVLTESAPVCYQVINGNTINVPAQYNILGNGRAGFNFGVYDHAYPLVIDPALLYSSYLGGELQDAAYGIAVDNAGCAYVTGFTESLNFPVSGNTFNQTSNGCSDVFVTKVSADGLSLVYSTYFGGNNTDVGNGIVVNSTGWAFVTGFTTSLDFPTPNGTAKNQNISAPSPCPFPGCLGNADAFVAAIPPDALTLPYSTCIGGNYTDVGTSIDLDRDQSHPYNVYITGFTNSDTTDLFPISGSPYQPLLNNLGGPGGGASDAFIANIGIGVATPSYCSYLGGSSNEQGLGITSTAGGSYYVTGWTQSTNLTTTVGAFANNHGEKDVFVAGFTSLRTPIYITYYGGEGNDEGRGIAVTNISGTEYAYVTGVTYSHDYPTKPSTRFGSISFAPWAFVNSGTAMFGDAFITRLESPGKSTWSTIIGGGNSDGANGIALDVNKNIYITGYTSSTNFPIKNPIPTFGTKHAFQDAFITMVNSNLSSLNFSTYLGKSLDETGTGIAVSDPVNIYISGFTTSYDFPVCNSFIADYGNNGDTYGDRTDGFVVHMDNRPTPAPPNASFVSDKPTGGPFPLTVNFTSTSTGSPDHYAWNFGDSPTNGTYAPTQVHTFTAAGTYTVTLTVWNSFGNSTVTHPMIVSIPPGVKFTNMTTTQAIGKILLANNTTTNVRFYLNYTQYGLLGYNFTLRSNNSDVVEFWEVAKPDWMASYYTIFSWSNSALPDDNLTFKGMDLYDQQGYGATDVLLANITLKGMSAGCTVINISSVNSLENDLLQNMTVHDYNLTVCVMDILPIPESKRIPPRTPTTPLDPNHDGLYEDINGDSVDGGGAPDFYDVIDFFWNLEWMQNHEPVEFFDFNGNGYIEFGDVFTLFETGLP
ncbi:MAG: SBBP repeat-containing protein [Methanomicrobiales archaeon]